MATSAPIPVTLYPNEDAAQPSEYALTAFDLRDVQQIDNFVRSRIYAAALQGLEGNHNSNERAEVLDSAGRVALSVSFYGRNGAEYIRNVEGYAMLLLVGLQKKHPAMTLQQCVDIVRDDRNQDQFALAYSFMRYGKAAIPKPEAKTDQPNPTDTDSQPTQTPQAPQ